MRRLFTYVKSELDNLINKDSMKNKKGSVVKQEKSAEVQKLKNRVRKLEKLNRDLISKLNAAEKLLEENLKFLKDSVKDVSLEDLIDAAKSKKSLKQVKSGLICPKCGESGMKTMDTLFGVLESCGCGYTNKRNK